MNTHIRCVGVPEHFNLPWHWAIENGSFQKEGITLLWNDEPKGTGAMCAALQEGSTDIAVMVASGTVRECLQHENVKIIGTFVDSPLTWGVHVPAGCDLQTPKDAIEQRFAISRFNSGSHLMAFVYAAQNGWKPKEEDFEIVHDLNGARKVFVKGPDLLFLWEKFTTDFLVELGEFRLIDEIKTEWPCFLIAARTEAIKAHGPDIGKLLTVVQREAGLLMQRADGPTLIAERYELPLKRAEEWWKTVQWNTNGSIDPSALHRVAHTLHELGVLEEDHEPNELFKRITWTR